MENQDQICVTVSFGLTNPQKKKKKKQNNQRKQRGNKL